MGAARIIKSTIFSITSFKPSIKDRTVRVFSAGTANRAVPKRMAKKIICNILLLLDAADTMFSGTRSSKNASGPRSLSAVAFWADSTAVCTNPSIPDSWLASHNLPGLTINAMNRPKTMAKMVVAI